MHIYCVLWCDTLYVVKAHWLVVNQSIAISAVQAGPETNIVKIGGERKRERERLAHNKEKTTEL